MSNTLIGRTTESINFTNNSFRKEIRGMCPVGTLVEINQDEMEDNPGFFHVSLEGTDGRIWAYVSWEQVTAA